MCGTKKTSNEQDGAKASLQMTEITYHPDTIVTTVLVSLGVVAVCVLVYLILHQLGFCASQGGSPTWSSRVARFSICHPRPLANQEEKSVFDE
jgi:hypothetical protein